jgi:hypothetical protein
MCFEKENTDYYGLGKWNICLELQEDKRDGRVKY